MAFDPKNLDTIDNYIAGRLSESECDLFEEALLEDIDLQATVFAQKELKLGMQDIADEILLSPKPSILERINEFLTAPSWAYASSLLLLVAVGWNFFPAETNTSQLGNRFIDQVVNVEQMRSSEEPVYRVEAHADILLSIDASQFVSGETQFNLYEQTRTKMSVYGLMPDEELYINLLIPALEPGQYIAELSNTNSQFGFRILVEE